METPPLVDHESKGEYDTTRRDQSRADRRFAQNGPVSCWSVQHVAAGERGGGEIPKKSIHQKTIPEVCIYRPTGSYW